MNFKRKYSDATIIFVLVALLFSSFSCTEEEGDVLFTGDSYENLMQFIDADSDFASFSQIVNSGNMTDALSSYNHNGGVNYTLFLPTNEAVTNFINENDRYSSLDALIEDSEYCAEIVRFHLVNGQIPSNEFPNGALANKTISNNFLTVLFREENDAVFFFVNDESKVLTTDIELSNGIIHTIDKMLTPIVFTSYQWIEQNGGFTIFTQMLTESGLVDTLNSFELDDLGREIYNEYTLFAESDITYAENGITSFEDLVSHIDSTSSGDADYTNPANIVNKYARYHILEKSVFLDDFDTEVYNTYGDLPLAVDLDDILKINAGTEVFEVLINGSDTLLVDYLQIKQENSNIVSRSGAIHQLDQLLFPYLPGRKTVTYQFYEEPVINALRNVEGEHSLSEDELDYISLIGTQSLSYIKSPTGITGCSNSDYIELKGDVELSFQTPKILAGRYTLRLVLDRGNSGYASIQPFVDDVKVGVVVDLTQESRQFQTFIFGTVEFSEFSTHTVTISAIIPGSILLDRIIFTPI